jgi:CxxC motif-containing protein (DUF1111 family)
MRILVTPGTKIPLHYAFITGVLVLACTMASVMADEQDSAQRALSAGAFTVMRFDQSAYIEPAPVLTLKQHQAFMFGRNVFQRKWAAVVSLNGDWGLGPTFIASQCSQCHVGDGRGNPPQSRDEQLLSLLVRLSIPGEDEHGGPRPHPNYGDQIQNRALQGQNVDLAYSIEPIPNEADLFLDWEEQTVALADGEQVNLRKPKLRIEHLNFGPLGPEVMMSLRIAQPVFGLGLLDAVPDQTILALAERQKIQGLNGRPNYVWDAFGKRTVLGRYGWKANQPSLRQQIVAAALGDMGVSSNIYPDQNCPPVQTACRRELPGNTPELADVELDATELWLRGLGVPARRNFDDALVKRGEKLFEQAQCAACHVPDLTTGAQFPPLPQLANQGFHAYTDLLLHDMGEGLSDGRPDFKAGPRDWRTPPLWGSGLSSTVNGSHVMLHDGRARNATEAILWHGGEALRAREAFRNMPKADRDALLKFLESI